MSWNQSAQSQLNEAETDSKTRSDLNDVFRKSEADRERRVCGTSVTSVLSVVLSVHSGVVCCVVCNGTMDGVSEDDLSWLQLDDFRMLLIKTIDPSRITPYLRQCQVCSCSCLFFLLLLATLLFAPVVAAPPPFLSGGDWFMCGLLYQVISAEDEEQLFNDPLLVIRRRKVGTFFFKTYQIEASTNRSVSPERPPREPPDPQGRKKNTAMFN